jgi:hypothetical protein
MKSAAGQRLLAVVVVALLVIGIGGVAFGAIPSSSGIVLGCYNTTTGAVRVIPSGACAAGESSLRWAQTNVYSASAAAPAASPYVALATPRGAFAVTGVITMRPNDVNNHDYSCSLSAHTSAGDFALDSTVVRAVSGSTGTFPRVSFVGTFTSTVAVNFDIGCVLIGGPATNGATVDSAKIIATRVYRIG